MKVSKDWLKELVDLKVPMEELERLLPLRTIGTKEITADFIELDMKGYNRADLLALRGIAYEVAAITDSKVKFTESSSADHLWVERKLTPSPVAIGDEDLNPLQCVAKIENLKVERSPDDWIKKLNDSGMRSVNNIADITNLIMLEYGQPLHSFNAESVGGDTINTRLAKDGEEITTLDGKVRKLSLKDIVLSDEEKALDVAGVMGGKDTEVKDSTSKILLSASLFNPSMVRKTSQRLGLISEASKRFYHGLTRKRLLQAFDAGLRMYEQIGGKVTALTIVGDTEDQIKSIPLTLEKTNSLIGVSLDTKEVEEYLTKLNFKIADRVNGSWVVEVPYFRLDVEIEEDLIEEIARMYGYENIPSTPLKGVVPDKTDQKLFELIYNLKKILADLGLTEIQTYSFYSTTVLKDLEIDKNKLVKIVNPISAETEYLKNDLWPNLVEVVDKNIRKGLDDIAIFEVGKVFKARTNDVPEEQYHLAIALSYKDQYLIPELKRVLDKSSEKLGLTINLGKEPSTELEERLFHPNFIFHLSRYGHKDDGEAIGIMAEVHPRITDRFGLNQRVAILEIDLEPLLT